VCRRNIYFSISRALNGMEGEINTDCTLQNCAYPSTEIWTESKDRKCKLKILRNLARYTEWPKLVSKM
jgi:hypothetical protein